MGFAPRIDGCLTIRSTAPHFVRAFEQRVAAGLLTGRPHARSNYPIVHSGPDRIQVSAADWWTAVNVGLNEIDVRCPQPNVLTYRVEYWRWARYVFGLSGVLGLAGVVLLLAFDARGYLARHPAGMFPGLSIDQSLAIAWTMAIFWGFVWPWVMIWLHKRPLHRLIARLVHEIDTGAPAR
jgi:hypothetical protein